MPEGWTLDGELQKLSHSDSTAEALASAGLLDHADEPFSLRVDFDWMRGGAETYIYGFSVVRDSGTTRYLMKACVAWGSGSLAEIFQAWLNRRETLASLGISVPRLYLHDAATLVEEFVEYDFFPHVATVSGQQRRELLHQAGITAGRLSAAGFLPISLVDWRTRGDDVVMVDFGQDLGDSESADDPGLATLSEVVTNLEAAGVALARSDMRVLEDGYTFGCGS
ncbi:hypothetical protein ACWDSJ_14280 [Nocardia sp. NPDC003482]